MQISSNGNNRLTYDGIYPCPVCRCGQISNLTLTEAFGCNVCRHILTIEPERQRITMIDRDPPLIWRWNGTTWKGEQIGNLELTWVYWVAALVLVVFPPTLIGASAVIFPPASGTDWTWFPLVWTGVAFFSHLFLVFWLIAEAYQFPFWLFLKTRWRQIRTINN
ncbi:hypothetical protein [Lyngbya sp. CCY1209]|jgi:hypothetical protein|uniref:hypothetical protein n=1 Tax=Lyngbya sp. CCY1209 TaxID=2886103 RepID=UPI002D200374|nr:hypothetical protein [Lyngbya sp. CCY1209]MEB3887326.1 hypothetical protein [Lyngbya sp. CCY1209]